jgi:amidohydrolase
MTDYYKEAQELFSYTQDLRRDFHRYPELGFQEYRTAGIVARELNQLGLEVTTGIGKTGVVALVEGENPGPVALLRFDMDALPITEETGASYASQNPGVMHACGHDGHTAIGLTVARLLHNHRQDLAGTVKLVFQPAEEGLGGAEGMIADGVLQNPRPDLALSLHLWNEAPFGRISVTPGPAMAAADVFRITVTGKGGHGAAPHLAVDPVLASAQIITALQSIVSRNVSPLKSAVISVTTIHAGEAFNVIPPLVKMEGTIRTFEPVVRTQLLERFHALVESMAGSLGCQSEVEILHITPAVINDAQVTGRVQQVTRNLFPEYELAIDYRTMGSEDMAFMMQEIPGCYFFIGSANAELGLDYAHHHPKFDVDERALVVGSALMAAAAADFLK